MAKPVKDASIIELRVGMTPQQKQALKKYAAINDTDMATLAREAFALYFFAKDNPEALSHFVTTSALDADDKENVFYRVDWERLKAEVLVPLCQTLATPTNEESGMA